MSTALTKKQTAGRTPGSLRRGVMPRLEALDLVALRIDEIQKQGTPEHAKAARIADKAVEQWKHDFHTRCPHCGARHNTKLTHPADRDRGA